MNNKINVINNLAFRMTHKLVSHPLFSQYFNSIDDFKEMTGYESHQLHELFDLDKTDVTARFEKLGIRLYRNYKPPFIDISEFLDYAAHELNLLIDKRGLEIETTEVSRLQHQIKNAIAKSYFYQSLKDIEELAGNSYEGVNSALNIHFLWLQQIAAYMQGKSDEMPEKDHLSCGFAHWLDSMEAELLLSSVGNGKVEKHGKIILAHRMIHQQLSYVISFVNEQDFALANSHLEIMYKSVLELDQQVRSLELLYLEDEEYNFYNYINQKSLEAEGLYYFLTVRVLNKRTQVNGFKKLLNREYQYIKKQLNVLFQAFTIDAVTLLYENQITVFFQKTNVMQHRDVLTFMEGELHPLIENMSVRNGFSARSIAINMDTIQPYQDFRIQILRQLSSFEVGEAFTYLTESQAERLYQHSVQSQKIAEIAEKALDQGALEVFFQPIVQNQPLQKEYVEALVRAPSDDGFIAADRFIQFLESENKMSDLDRLVMEKIKEMIPRLSQVVNKLSINIYPSTFNDADLMNDLIQLRQALDAADIQLVVEITEYQFMQDIEVIEKLSREYGIVFAMDDFGSGYSNLLQLIEYAERGVLEILKVDGSIVRKIDTNETVFKVLKTIINIAQILGLTPVVMEYVYKEEIHQKLETLGVPLCYQGFYFSEPLSLQQLEERYAASN